MIDFIFWSNEIFNQNKAMGWEGEEDFPRRCNLIISELSEGIQADRENLPDDKLPEFQGIDVEIVDAVIRILSFLGRHQYTAFSEKRRGMEVVPFDLQKALMEVTVDVSKAFITYSNSQGDMWIPHTLYVMERALQRCLYILKVREVDVEKLIALKVSFNKSRLDHKKDTRTKKY